MRHPDFGELQCFREAQLFIDETEAFTRRFLATLFDWHDQLGTSEPCRKTAWSSHMIYIGELADFDRTLVAVRFAYPNRGVLIGRADFNAHASTRTVMCMLEKANCQRQEFLKLVAPGPIIRVEDGTQQFSAFAWRTITPMYLTRDLMDFLPKHLNAIWELLSREHPELEDKMNKIVERAKEYGFPR